MNPFPLVYWSQTETHLYLEVDLKNAENSKVEFGNKLLKFSARGYGTKGVDFYKFSLFLFSDIDQNQSYLQEAEIGVLLTLQKFNKIWWPRLTAQHQKSDWLQQVDYDYFSQPEDNVEEEDTTQNQLQQEIVNCSKKSQQGTQKKTDYKYTRDKGRVLYLILYNIFQFFGFLYILVLMQILYCRHEGKMIPHTYGAVGDALKFLQLLQYLEVMHPIFRYTKESVLLPLIRVNGRNFIVFCMIDQEPRMHEKPVVFWIIISWTLIEVVRFPYYVTRILEKKIPALTWLRYTIWIPIYPLITICQGVIILRNILYFEETKRFSIEMPNEWNFTFSMPIFMFIYFLAILPGTYLHMKHMSNVRAELLGKIN